jgi:hypothetical protein
MRNQRRMSVMILVLRLGIITGTPWLGSMAVGQSASEVTSVSDLLQRYTRALDATQSFTDTYQQESDFAYRMPQGALEGRKFTRGQIRSDGERLYHQDYSWGDIRSGTMNLPESTPNYHLRLAAEGKLYTGVTSITTPRMKGYVDLQSGYGTENITHHPYSGVYGYLGANERMDTVLRGSQQISIRPSTARVNGVACHVIDAHAKYGQYTVWLDPTHGYNAAKVTRKAIGGNHEKEHQMPRGDHAEDSVVITRFEQVGNTWVPVEADQHTVYTSGELFRNSRSHYKRENIVLDPDHDKLGSFANPLQHPANDPELENEARVQIRVPNSAMVKGTWQDGKIIDEAGQVIDLTQLLTMWANTKDSLLDTPLPALTDLSPALSQVQNSDKPLLVCLCDIQQRASRNCLSRLSQEASGLSAKGLVIVVIHVSPVSETNQAWLRIQDIDLPIHTWEGDFEAKKAAWAVKGLPWLILTDKEHVVTGEGLSVEEVEKMISH